MDWPLSIVGEGGVIAPVLRSGLTVTMLPDEQAEDGVLAMSVTLT
jgi:hypothetical protein